MDKKRTRKLAAGAVALLAVVGAGGAVAATRADSPSQERQKILDDAAKELGVTATELSAALKTALKNRVDEALEAGKLTEDEARALKERIDQSDYPLLFAGPKLFGGHHVFGGGPLQLDAAASYLGLTEAELRTELRSGSTLAEVAKEQGKAVAGLVDAMVAAAKKDLDAAVGAGKLTRTQADAIAEGLEERLTALVNGEHGRHMFGGSKMGFFDGPRMGFERHGFPGFGTPPEAGGAPASFTQPV
jgi:hypothetical protein